MAERRHAMARHFEAATGGLESRAESQTTSSLRNVVKPKVWAFSRARFFYLLHSLKSSPSSEEF